MIYRLRDRDYAVNEYVQHMLSGERHSCHSCILNGVTPMSKEFYNMIYEKIGENIGPCSSFSATLRKLGYENVNPNVTGCKGHQNQALALYLLLSKPKEKRK